MAITGSDATVDTSLRDSLKATSVDASITGTQGRDVNQYLIGSLVGVTPNMAASISKGIDEYKNKIEKILNELEAVDSQNAFRGTEITSTLTRFIESVKSVSKSYLEALTKAQEQIVTNVAKAYEQQDTDISSQLGADSSKVEGAAATR